MCKAGKGGEFDGAGWGELARSNFATLFDPPTHPRLLFFAATERIRQFKYECGDIPIVAVTAFDTYGMRDAAAEAGCDAYLLKPLALDEMSRSSRDPRGLTARPRRQRLRGGRLDPSRAPLLPSPFYSP